MHGVHVRGVGERRQVPACRAQLGGHRLARGDRTGGGVPRRGGQGAQVRAELGAVGLRQDRAEHGHAERTGHLAGGVGQRRTSPGPLSGHHRHDRLGGGRHDQAHPRALDEERHGQHPDRRGDVE